MVNVALYAMGIAGNIISVGLFLSPGMAFWKIIKSKSSGDYTPIPYVATWLNCMMWLLYGSPFIKFAILVVTINGFGFLIEALYIAIYTMYSRGKKLRDVLIMIAVDIIFFAGVVLIVLLATSDKGLRRTIVGILCVVFNSIMYLSPLAIMKTVIRTKSTEFMPLPLSVFNFLNGTVWTIYAIIARDVYILIPNGLGVFFSICQLVLYACYCAGRKQTPEERKNVESSRSSV